MPITFDYILFERDFIWKSPIKKDGHRWFYFGDSEQEMEDEINKYASQEEKDLYYEEKNKKIPETIFDLLKEE